MQRPVFLIELDDGVEIERAQGAKVDEFGVDAKAGELGDRLGRIAHADTERNDRDVFARLGDARLAKRQDKVVELWHVERLAVEDLVLEEDHRIGIADSCLEQAFRIGGGIGNDDTEAGYTGVPGRIVLAVLGGDAGGSAVGAAENDRGTHLAAGHVEGLCRRVDDLVDRLHGKIPGHELDDRAQSGKRRADAKAGKAVLGDRRVDDAFRAELLEEALGHLVGALIFRDLLAHDEDVLVAAHLLGHGVAQRFADGDVHGLGAGRQDRDQAPLPQSAPRAPLAPAQFSA